MPVNDVYPDSIFMDAVVTDRRLSAPEIADVVGCNARIATIRLKRLAAAGKIESVKVSGRWMFWRT